MHTHAHTCTHTHTHLCAHQHKEWTEKIKTQMQQNKAEHDHEVRRLTHKCDMEEVNTASMVTQIQATMQQGLMASMAKIKSLKDKVAAQSAEIETLTSAAAVAAATDAAGAGAEEENVNVPEEEHMHVETEEAKAQPSANVAETDEYSAAGCGFTDDADDDEYSAAALGFEDDEEEEHEPTLAEQQVAMRRKTRDRVQRRKSMAIMGGLPSAFQ